MKIFFIFVTLSLLSQAKEEKEIKKQLIPCNCGSFLKIDSIGEFNELKIDKTAIENLLNNETVIGRRFYLIGNFGETEVIDGVILKELYTNVRWS